MEQKAGVLGSGLHRPKIWQKRKGEKFFRLALKINARRAQETENLRNVSVVVLGTKSKESKGKGKLIGIVVCVMCRHMTEYTQRTILQKTI